MEKNTIQIKKKNKYIQFRNQKYMLQPLSPFTFIRMANVEKLDNASVTKNVEK